MKRAPLVLTLLVCAQAQQTTRLSDIRPLSYVQVLGVEEGKPLLLKNVTCQADGKPETLGRVYLQEVASRQIRVARIEYNEQGRYVLEHSKTTEPSTKYFDKYVNQQQPFGVFTMNALISLWKVFGMKFNLDNVTYRCQLT